MTVPPRLIAALGERYAVERVLGHGGMATVYLARDIRHDRPVAVKVLHGDLASSIGATRFLREIGIIARLQHPHILTLIDSGEARDSDSGDTLLYYVMPYVDGESLRTLLARETTMAVPHVLRTLREVVDALAYAHRQGFVHRDIKPDNVMLAGDHALVLDFGIARALTTAARAEPLTGTGISIGTPAYMSPEQAAGEPDVDHRADIYAVGVLAFEMLAGRPPFQGPAGALLASHVTATPPALRELRPSVPPELASLVHRCLEKEPSRRFATADGLLAAIVALAPVTPVGTEAWSGRRRPWMLATATVLVAVTLAGWVLWRSARERWVRQTALPAVVHLADVGDHDSAFVILTRASAILPRDSAVAALWPLVSYVHAFRSDPAGARVYRAPFADSTRWELIGTTPTDSLRLPRGLAYLRFEHQGYLPRTLYAGGYIFAQAVSGADFPTMVQLLPDASADSGMVVVEGPLVAAAGAEPRRLQPFLVGRHEVTNREYQRFVDAGGYQRREFWVEPFDDGGRTVSWDAAVSRFVDRTGVPGPATWEGGAPRPGEEDLPVGGVSWYEAAAYARFAGAELPTRNHWIASAVLPAARWIVSRSVFEAERPKRVGESGAMSPTGAYDMAGNVREWTSTPDEHGHRFLLGGGFTESGYRFADVYAHAPFDRVPINGLRIAKFRDPPEDLALARVPVRQMVRDYSAERPVAQSVFDGFRPLYDYDPLPLDARVERRDTTNADWVREIVSFAGPVAGQRMRGVLFLPRRGRAPYQVAVVFPHAGALFETSVDAVEVDISGFLVRNGRAVFHPILSGTYDQRDREAPGTGNESVAFRDAMLRWGREFRRAVEYAGSRAELDSSRIALFGVSMGGRLGGMMLAIEPRLKVGVLYVAGLGPARVRPEVDVFNFLPHVRAPVLMLNGRYDPGFPLVTSQQPYLANLGTPARHKRQVLFEDSHWLPRAQAIAETLRWFDRYLGKP